MTTMKRSRLRPVSKKRRAENVERKALMEEKFGPRENWRCAFPQIDNGFGLGCFGDVNGHEVLKRSRGGSVTDMTIVVLACQYHNDWVEENPRQAHRMGLAAHAWDDAHVSPLTSREADSEDFQEFLRTEEQ
jgi:hypothetical protein